MAEWVQYCQTENTRLICYSFFIDEHCGFRGIWKHHFTLKFSLVNNELSPMLF